MVRRHLADITRAGYAYKYLIESALVELITLAVIDFAYGFSGT